MSKISRRSFLKLVGAAAPAVLFPAVTSWAEKNLNQGDSSKPNVIILLLDAMSATNLSVYGYPRPTTTNLERFADHATVYHSHYSGGNYTIPGTASLLTGTYPWTSRALNYSAGVKADLIGDNIFGAFGEDYHRLAFPQSMMANFVVSQFQDDINTFLPADAFGKLNFLLNDYFPKDRNMALRALDDFMFQMQAKPASLVLGPLQWSLYYRDSARLATKGYPMGLPHNSTYPIYFNLEDLFGGITSLIPALPQPFFTYLHLYPPHAPYRASERFDSKFVGDGWWPNAKPVHRFSDGFSETKLTSTRRRYDEYIASLDWEIGKLFDAWEAEGVFENSYVIVTSDHGEMFERGEARHTTALLYDPVVHIPLLISAPGQKIRHDVHAPTNAVDVLPTLMQLTGNSIPTQTEGKLLPGLGGVEDFERSTFTVEAKRNPAYAPLTKATVAMRKGTYKLIYYTGYEAQDSFELYDLAEDGEELRDLYPEAPEIAKKLREELLETLLAADTPYIK
ncbi:MAG: sulfatase-like hydrolase/transferase [Anaerolineales bacterium]|nr:sulfatase-like hydrolase/transferase [Anaerolineales bacterium]